MKICVSQFFLGAGLLLGFAGCVLPESTGEAKVVTEFGGSPALSGLYRNDGSVIIDGTKTSAFLFTVLGQQPKGEFFKPGDLVRIALENDDRLIVTWLRADQATVSSVTFEREKDYVREEKWVRVKARRMAGGGLAGTQERRLAVDPDGRLKVLEIESYGRDLGAGPLLSKRYVNIMTFEPVR